MTDPETDDLSLPLDKPVIIDKGVIRVVNRLYLPEGFEIGRTDEDDDNDRQEALAGLGPAIAAGIDAATGYRENNYRKPELWTCKKNLGDNTFDVERPGQVRSAVGAEDPLAFMYLFPPATVVLRYYLGDYNQPRIVSIGPFMKIPLSVLGW